MFNKKDDDEKPPVVPGRKETDADKKWAPYQDENKHLLTRAVQGWWQNRKDKKDGITSTSLGDAPSYSTDSYLNDPIRDSIDKKYVWPTPIDNSVGKSVTKLDLSNKNKNKQEAQIKAEQIKPVGSDGSKGIVVYGDITIGAEVATKDAMLNSINIPAGAV
jgi:hypothetical protein